MLAKRGRKPFCLVRVGLALQVNMQALVLVSLFRQQTRDKLMEYVEWCLPDRIPWLWDRMRYRQTPAQMVHSAIVNKISSFQASVARRQSVSRSDQRCGAVPARHIT